MPGMGSSPLTRGKPVRWVDQLPLWGLIPAHAGKTAPTVVPQVLKWAHPRSRGENPHARINGDKAGGSSPLTRRKPFDKGSDYNLERLIPAHAGKTCQLTPGSTRVTAHPRSRGENAHPRSRGENKRSITRLNLHEGSSPLTRGKRFQLSPRRWLSRLIPAHAGKTRRGTPTTRSRPAHPRSRGENVGLSRGLS